MPRDTSPVALEITLDPPARPPLTVLDVIRIVADARKRGLLLCDNIDHAPNDAANLYAFSREVDGITYVSPHGAVDAYLGIKRKASCPCNPIGSAKPSYYLSSLEDHHRLVMRARMEARNLTTYEAQFEELLTP